MGILIYTVSEPDAGKCVKTILTERLEISHGLLSRLKRRESGICVNGQKVYSTYVLRAGDVITIDVSDREPPHRLEPVKMDLDIVY